MISKGSAFIVRDSVCVIVIVITEVDQRLIHKAMTVRMEAFRT